MMVKGVFQPQVHISSIFFQHHLVPHRGQCCPTATFMGLEGHNYVPWCFLVPQRPYSITLSHETLLEIAEETQRFSTSFSLLLAILPLLAAVWRVCSLGWLGRALRREKVALQGRGENPQESLNLPLWAAAQPHRWYRVMIPARCRLLHSAASSIMSWLA